MASMKTFRRHLSGELDLTGEYKSCSLWSEREKLTWFLNVCEVIQEEVSLDTLPKVPELTVGRYLGTSRATNHASAAALRPSGYGR